MASYRHRAELAPTSFCVRDLSPELAMDEKLVERHVSFELGKSERGPRRVTRWHGGLLKPSYIPVRRARCYARCGDFAGGLSKLADQSCPIRQLAEVLERFDNSTDRLAVAPGGRIPGQLAPNLLLRA
jgi:hypothetical protein